jgi:hypothetical protein
MVILVSISNKKIMNDNDRAIDVTGGFNVVSQTQIGNSNESQPFKGLVFSEILEIIMMLL